MRRIGEIKAKQNRAEHDAHLARPLAERLEHSWKLYLAYHGSLTAHEDDPSELYQRARALGLYRP